MKNLGKDGYGKSEGFLPLKGSIITEFSPFEIVKLRARKSLRSSYTFALLLSPRWEMKRRKDGHNALWLEKIKPNSVGY